MKKTILRVIERLFLICSIVGIIDSYVECLTSYINMEDWIYNPRVWILTILSVFTSSIWILFPIVMDKYDSDN